MIERIKQGLWENKEGIILGGLIGFLLGKFVLPTTFDLQAIAQANSVLDFVKAGTSNIIEFAKTKIIIASTIVGSLAGGIIDNMMPERFVMKRWRWFR